ncbi:MAG: DUF721 domain-containing protein [Deltaproteobacteria bacterium]|nr:DUF721 domain-containing protein [Deltaproteobacteria bacterium]
MARKPQEKLEHISDTLVIALKKHRLKFIGESISLQKLWLSAAGSIICEHSKPFKLKGKELHVAVSNSSWLQQISINSSILLEKIREIPDAPEINKIKLSLDDFPKEHTDGRMKVVNIPLTEKEKRFVEATVASLEVDDQEFKDIVRRVLKKAAIRRRLLGQ